MRKFTFVALVAALLPCGCVPEWSMYLQSDRPAVADDVEKKPSEPVTAEQITDKNATDMGLRLQQEIERDEKSSRGNTMERSKLEIP